jgi:hypothetical protein
MRDNTANSKNKRKFNVIVDGVGYNVAATPFNFNDQVRYHVQVNEGDPAVFAWDSQMSMFKSLNDDASVLPDGLTQAINTELLKTP